MVWKIELTSEAVKSLSKMDKAEARRISRFLKERLAVADDPRLLGKPLKGVLGEFWAYRIGHYRLICTLQDDIFCVVVIRIGHRKEIYR